MFKKVLVANRGEIARRIGRTAKKMGLGVVAVHSEADVNMPFVTEADEAVLLGPPPPKQSYLNLAAVIAAAEKTGADALHPGYGFLSESEELVSACERAGITFIGPPPAAMKVMGTKVEAKQAVKAAGVPVVPGSEGAVGDVEEAVKLAEEIGYPVMLKASAGGGGIGMTLCKKEKKLRSSFEDNQKKGEMFFGSNELLLEKAIVAPHHVEVQVLGDTHGHVMHLFERECSVQRRNQKVLEETPSPFISADTRAAMCAAAVKVAEAVGYVGAGTVEFIVDADQNFYFLEMNTRLQVEHPVTEMTLGIDLVEWQFKVAAGESIAALAGKKPQGHAIEARVCAEDPEKRFFPSPGELSRIVWPTGEGVRVDAAVDGSATITPFYDSLIAKVIAHGKDRDEAIARLRAALAATTLEGTATNLALFDEILGDETFGSGTYTTAYLAEVLGKKS